MKYYKCKKCDAEYHNRNPIVCWRIGCGGVIEEYEKVEDDTYSWHNNIEPHTTMTYVSDKVRYYVNAKDELVFETLNKDREWKESTVETPKVSFSWDNPATPKEFDPVTKPAGYNQGKIECSDYIADQKLDFFSGNVIKYVVRHKFKNGVEDLKKARWYLNYLIKEYEGGSRSS